MSASNADLFAWPRSPMMTKTGIAAEGLSADEKSRRIAAETVSPQQVAVLGADTEMHFAVIPVIMKYRMNILLQRYEKYTTQQAIISMNFLLIKVNSPQTSSLIHQTSSLSPHPSALFPQPSSLMMSFACPY